LFTHETENKMNKNEKSLAPDMPHILTLQHMSYS